MGGGSTGEGNPRENGRTSARQAGKERVECGKIMQHCRTILIIDNLKKGQRGSSHEKGVGIGIKRTMGSGTFCPPPPPNEIINLGKCLTDLSVQNFTPTQLIKEISKMNLIYRKVFFAFSLKV